MKVVAVITVIKAGFLVTARGGSGIVIAKLDNSITSGICWFVVKCPSQQIFCHVGTKAKCLAIITVIKAGFLVSARGGSNNYTSVKSEWYEPLT